MYRDAKVTVTAFSVPHGNLVAYGYRFQTPDRVIVISGDTSPSDNIVTACNGCDVLVHEHYSVASFARVEPRWQATGCVITRPYDSSPSSPPKRGPDC